MTRKRLRLLGQRRRPVMPRLLRSMPKQNQTPAGIMLKLRQGDYAGGKESKREGESVVMNTPLSVSEFRNSTASATVVNS